MSLMSYIEYLECSKCGKKFDADKLQTVCDSCGKPLLVRYDLGSAGEAISRNDLSRREASMWR